MTLPHTWCPVNSSWLRVYLTSPVALTLSLVLCSMLVNFAVLAWLGIQHGGDTARYLDGASNLLAGRPFQEKQHQYLGYVAVVAVCRLSGAGEKGVIILQIGIMSLATLALYDLGRQLSGHFTGLLAAFCLVANVEIARWNTYILTDSLYISLVVLSTGFIHRAAERAQWQWYVGGAGVVLCAAFMRPHGWVLAPVTTVYWITRAKIGRRAKRGAMALVLIVFVGGAAFLGAFHQDVKGESPGTWLRQGVVVWGYDGWRVPMPVETNESGDDLVDTLRYALRHPWPSMKLAVARVAAELLHARPFYSLLHNVLVVIFGLIVYPLAVLGVLRLKRTPLAQLMSAIIGSHMLFVALTFADWDGRFLLYVIPLILLFAACRAAEWARHKLVGVPGRIPVA